MIYAFISLLLHIPFRIFSTYYHYAIMHDILASFPAAKLISMSLSFASSERAKVWLAKASSGPFSAPVPSPSYQGMLSYLFYNFLLHFMFSPSLSELINVLFF